MGSGFYVDSARRLVYIKLGGVLSVAGIATRMGRLRNYPQFDPAFSSLWDLNEAYSHELRLSDYIVLAQSIDPFLPSARRAIAASRPSEYGSARIYQSLLPDSSRCHVCCTVQEAWEWIEMGTKRALEYEFPVVQSYAFETALQESAR